jgi:hypothetical protein
MNTNGMDGKYPASYMTASFPYPGVTGVNIHAFTLYRGILQHQQSRLTPHGC